MGGKYSENGGIQKKMWRLGGNRRASQLISNPSVGRGQPSAECNATLCVGSHGPWEKRGNAAKGGPKGTPRGPMDCMQTLHPPPPTHISPTSAPFFPTFPHFPPFFLRPSPSIPTPCVPLALKTTVSHLWGAGLSPFLHSSFQKQYFLTRFPPFVHIFRFFLSLAFLLTCEGCGASVSPALP